MCRVFRVQRLISLFVFKALYDLGTNLTWNVVAGCGYHGSPGVQSAWCQSLLGQMFLTGHRLLAREVQQRRRRGKQAVARAYELPRSSEHVLSIVLDFVGCVVDEDGAQTVVGNSQLHFRRCWEVLGVNASVRCASYGWHAQQLTAAEYCAFVNREASANLDLMTEARGRPRPAHAEKAAADGEVDLGLEAEFVDLGDEAVVSDIDVDELPVKPDLQYQPRLHVF